MVGAALGLAALALLVGCSDDGSMPVADHMDMHASSSEPALEGPDRPVAGPQGRVPQFLVECPFSHSAPDDPIVFPGQPGSSHMHLFFGNATTDASSTYDSLIAGESECDQRLDTAAYWVPALYAGDRMVTPTKSVAYYRPGEGVDPTIVEPYPPGLKIVAGNAGATEEQSTGIVAWTCGAGIARDVLPPSCPTGRPLRMVVTFPDCWDGAKLDAADHHSHMAYSRGGECPTTHPHAVPQLQFSVAYDFSGDASELSLASGPIITGHADFFNAWDQTKLESEIDDCLHREVVCGVTSGRK